jgi:hypothetical protein
VAIVYPLSGLACAAIGCPVANGKDGAPNVISLTIDRRQIGLIFACAVQGKNNQNGRDRPIDTI